MKLKRILKWTAPGILLRLFVAFLVGFIAYWRSTNECHRHIAAPASPMKAIRYDRYGVVTLDDFEKPAPKDNQVPSEPIA